MWHPKILGNCSKSLDIFDFDLLPPGRPTNKGKRIDPFALSENILIGVERGCPHTVIGLVPFWEQESLSEFLSHIYQQNGILQLFVLTLWIT